MVSCNEEALEAKETVISAFVSIEGASSNTTSTTTDDALANKGVTVSGRRWISVRLSDRSSGIKQFKLIRELDNKEVCVLGYADDFDIFVRGKYEAISFLQRVRRIAQI